MSTATAEVTELDLPRGRMDHDQQEAVVNLEPVKDRLEHLEQLYAESCDAAEQFSEAVKATAEESGLLAKVLRKYIVARVGEKLEERQREHEQLSFLFEIE